MQVASMPLALLMHGFSFDDIAELNEQDARYIPALVATIRKKEEIERLTRKLDLAEAFNLSFVGSQYDQHGRNSAAYHKWIRNTEKAIMKLQGITLPTIWNDLRRSKRV